MRGFGSVQAAFAHEALSRWDSRIKATRAVVTTFDRRAYIRIYFDVVDVNLPGNNVLVKDAYADVPVPQ